MYLIVHFHNLNQKTLFYTVMKRHIVMASKTLTETLKYHSVNMLFCVGSVVTTNSTLHHHWQHSVAALSEWTREVRISIHICRARRLSTQNHHCWGQQITIGGSTLGYCHWNKQHRASSGVTVWTFTRTS